ncbi:hypothetical protein NBRC3280_3122 [Acetobacter pasteurianus NBRC 3280]|uniref:Uncharacterized protein n=2 Tax=Acetobacter pasteurianus TaxID=438 RepID=A0A401WXC8_ACEPA|nr:hypothetical protein NBRC3188_2706 [Acetobacter pasteurianus NBRC 3188]GCD60525.1 hypothetical protein NBRC3277_3100 [Acetobacter pasteurianus NBRC 3277]GCD64084.1 hypothetical protein NBRC3278_3177 [Acetobacter pasteurianus NBRC 3278]GCD70487.1 hypothetical protein NBRC3280_3122 [Acetobacter pasteurianus NBRC 3280]
MSDDLREQVLEDGVAGGASPLDCGAVLSWD